MNFRDKQEGFHFGIEAEYMLVDAATFRPLWHRDLTFEGLYEPLVSIAVDDLPPLDGLKLETPHRKLMPYVVEGYHVPDPEFNPIDLLPKGVEIRTPICSSIEECLACLRTLYDRMQAALEKIGYRAVALSHHPVETHFEGPQNKRRYDFWRWAMEVMTTYGPDINISLPKELGDRLDLKDLHAKADYYGPALAALTMGLALLRRRTVAHPGPNWKIVSHPPPQRFRAVHRTPPRGKRADGVQALRDDAPAR